MSDDDTQNKGDNHGIKASDFKEDVGADGLTDDQWENASQPGADPNLKKEYQEKNTDDEHNDEIKPTDTDDDSSQPTSTIQVLIADPAEAADLGHTAIQIGNVVYGYYPTGPDPRNPENAGSSQVVSSKGRLDRVSRSKFNAQYSPQGFTSIIIKVTPGNIVLLKAYYEELAKNPGTYSVVGRQCTSVAIDALSFAGLKIYHVGLHSIPAELNGWLVTPEGLKHALLNQFYSPFMVLDHYYVHHVNVPQ